MATVIKILSPGSNPIATAIQSGSLGNTANPPSALADSVTSSFSDAKLSMLCGFIRLSSATQLVFDVALSSSLHQFWSLPSIYIKEVVFVGPVAHGMIGSFGPLIPNQHKHSLVVVESIEKVVLNENSIVVSKGSWVDKLKPGIRSIYLDASNNWCPVGFPSSIPARLDFAVYSGKEDPTKYVACMSDNNHFLSLPYYAKVAGPYVLSSVTQYWSTMDESWFTPKNRLPSGYDVHLKRAIEYLSFMHIKYGTNVPMIQLPDPLPSFLKDVGYLIKADSWVGDRLQSLLNHSTNGLAIAEDAIKRGVLNHAAVPYLLLAASVVGPVFATRFRIAKMGPRPVMHLGEYLVYCASLLMTGDKFEFATLVNDFVEKSYRPIMAQLHKPSGIYSDAPPMDQFSFKLSLKDTQNTWIALSSSAHVYVCFGAGLSRKKLQDSGFVLTPDGNVQGDVDLFKSKPRSMFFNVDRFDSFDVRAQAEANRIANQNDEKRHNDQKQNENKNKQKIKQKQKQNDASTGQSALPQTQKASDAKKKTPDVRPEKETRGSKNKDKKGGSDDFSDSIKMAEQALKPVKAKRQVFVS